MYIAGGAYAICDVCGFQHRLKELRKRWDGLMVCSADWDPKPAVMTPPSVKPEGVPLPNARPDNQTNTLPGSILIEEDIFVLLLEGGGAILLES